MLSKYKIFRDRPDLRLISELIEPGSRVIDLGCGDGSLLSYLIENKSVSGAGIELHQDKIIQCVKKGISVVHGNINQALTEIRDKSYDYVILSQTLQSVKNADIVLKEMSRVGRKILVSFINFGYYKCRLQLMFRGRMPLTRTLPYQWYNTPNIHLGTIKDFRLLTSDINLKIVREIQANSGTNPFAGIWPNLFADTSVFMLEEKS